jgi:hypothetical protein
VEEICRNGGNAAILDRDEDLGSELVAMCWIPTASLRLSTVLLPGFRRLGSLLAV